MYVSIVEILIILQYHFFVWTNAFGTLSLSRMIGMFELEAVAIIWL